MTSAYWDGWNAWALKRLDDTFNPYDRGTKKWQDWNDGWTDALLDADKKTA